MIYLLFCPDFLVIWKKWFDKKDKVNFKIYDVTQTGQQIITIHLLPNVSKSKGTQAIKFCLSIEYKMINIFLEISYTKKCRGKAIPRPCYKKSKLCLSLDQQSERL